MSPFFCIVPKKQFLINPKLGDKIEEIKFAWYPVKLTNGKWIWLKKYKKVKTYTEVYIDMCPIHDWWVERHEI